jgi:peptidoglycan-associated lipoprotein
MRHHHLLLAVVMTPALALGAVACAHHAPPPVQSATTTNAARANPPVTISLRGKSPVCASGNCGAYEHLVAVLERTVLHFDYNSPLLKPAAAQQLQAVAKAMRAVPDVTVRISGNCDERGTEEYNLALGQERADAARQYLTALGISERRIGTVSYGKEHPLDIGHNETAWRKNRRDELIPVVHRQ